MFKDDFNKLTSFVGDTDGLFEGDTEGPLLGASVP